ncbi:DUF2254 domain-containing protein [soil metagenome]
MRLRLWLEAASQSFWAPPAAAMLIGGALGFIVPEFDNASNGVFGIFSTSEFQSARSLLEVIATVTVSVAGITFSVTIVVLQLASQQLGPRVLHTFQSRWIGRITLATFLGVFVYSLTALGRLGSVTENPNLVLTIAVTAAIAAFVLFTVFIHDIVISIRPSTVIRRIGADAQGTLEHLFPSGIGQDPDDTQTASTLLAGRMSELPSATAAAGSSGYLAAIDSSLIETAREADGFVSQTVMIGDFVVTGEELASVAAPSEPDQLAERIAKAFQISPSRSLVKDVAFPIRQLADLALRALSPSLNDPTTAENAAGAITEALVRFAEVERVEALRADSEGKPRFRALAPDLDGLVRLGFEQIRPCAADDPLLPRRLLHLFGQVERAALAAGRSTAEIERQAKLVRDATD